MPGSLISRAVGLTGNRKLAALLLCQSSEPTGDHLKPVGFTNKPFRVAGHFLWDFQLLATPALVPLCPCRGIHCVRIALGRLALPKCQLSFFHVHSADSVSYPPLPYSQHGSLEIGCDVNHRTVTDVSRDDSCSRRGQNRFHRSASSLYHPEPSEEMREMTVLGMATKG